MPWRRVEKYCEKLIKKELHQEQGTLSVKEAGTVEIQKVKSATFLNEKRSKKYYISVSVFL